MGGGGGGVGAGLRVQLVKRIRDASRTARELAMAGRWSAINSFTKPE